MDFWEVIPLTVKKGVVFPCILNGLSVSSAKLAQLLSLSGLQPTTKCWNQQQN